MTQEYLPEGFHYVLDCWDCDPILLDDEEYLTNLLVKAVDESGGTILNVVSRKFEPTGASGQVLMSESHSCYHSYPSNTPNFIGWDLYHCGTSIDGMKAVQIILDGIKPKKHFVKKIRRGHEDGFE
jgi:S-adenosylmethionine decarboxylase